MNPVIRIDDEVMEALRKKAIDLNMVFGTPNTTLRKVLGLDANIPTGEASLNPLYSKLNDAPKEIDKGEGSKMTAKASTLVIHAPLSQPGKKSFQEVFDDLIGEGYIIYGRDKNKLQIPGSPVVLLSNDQRRRAEGVIKALHPTSKSAAGKQRYDVHVDKWTEVPYRREALNRCGVAII